MGLKVNQGEGLFLKRYLTKEVKLQLLLTRKVTQVKTQELIQKETDKSIVI